MDLKSLSRVGAKPSFIDYLISVWSFRHFVFFDSRARVQSGNRQDRLGSAWLLLNPLLNGIGYFLIFGLLLGASRGIENFIGYLVIGVFLFQFSTRTIVNGSRVIRTNQNVIQAFNFPRATLVVSVNVREFIANIPVLLVMLLLILTISPVEEITWRWLLLIPAVFLQVLFNLGVGFLLAPLVARFNDLVHIISFFMRFWLFASCVMFSIERYESWPLIKSVVEANPLYLLLSIVRSSLLYAETPPWQSWAALAAWSLGALAIGIVLFWKGEETYGRNE
ncbi:ABC transporter permease [Arthrobacter caoxuetaonis]|uniref:Transport permease protein n=1 Tax=Arthrobacter caoxuetaonis TaxID=2886935 RepID=A0A9X1MCT0_9MICC|nr:ABC transporter permease [Arthrobacter caoxuetaonis]MCC3297608.1 ABC transporter permease [Arthrobacter caoxuetaonis]USQ56184.1 ABC transporter permease [Arthrobacter caoxuetaonis]